MLPGDQAGHSEGGMAYTLMVGLAMLFGFSLGLLSFRVKSRWCGRCGTVKSCPRCAGWATSVAGFGPAHGSATRGNGTDKPP